MADLLRRLTRGLFVVVAALSCSQAFALPNRVTNGGMGSFANEYQAHEWCLAELASFKGAQDPSQGSRGPVQITVNCVAQISTGWPQPAGTPHVYGQEEYDGGDGYWEIRYWSGSFSGTICTAPQQPQSNGTCADPAPTAAQCLLRNVPGTGNTSGHGVADRNYIVGTAPSSYCNAGCTMAVDAGGTPFGGINPATGAAVQWARHGQRYTGAVCTASVTNDADGNPDTNSVAVPGSGNTPAAWSCNAATGTCISPEGHTNFCTFTGTPPVRSACVPATGDGDGDGVPNATDSTPNDPQNGGDSGVGNETDNVSSGGGSCQSAPVSHGDGIAAQIAYQTWATRCAVEALPHGSTTSGTTTVNVAPNTAGNADLAAIKANTDSLKDNGSGFGQVTAAIPAEGVNASNAFGDPSVVTGISNGFDDSGWLTASRSCPHLPDITLPSWIGGGSINLDSRFTWFCTAMQFAGMFVWLFAALASIKIYSKVIG